MAESTVRLILLCQGAHEGRGAWFEAAHRGVLTRAAGEPNFSLVELDQFKLDQIDPDIPAGKLMVDGKPGPLPVLPKATFERLMQLSKPAQAGKSVAPKAAPVVPGAPGVPEAWTRLRVGSIVLASDGKGDGWWEAVVTAVEGTLLRLRWRDFPGHDHFSREMSRVGLLSPTGLR